MLRKVLGTLSVVNESISMTARNTSGMLLIAMTAIVLVQIVFRYVLNDSLIWTEEVSKTMMVWGAFLIAPWAYRNGANVSIQMFTDELPIALRRLLHLLLNLLVIWIIVVFWSESFGMVERGFSIKTASLPIQVGWFFIVIPIAFGAMILVGVELLIRDVLALLHPKENFEIAGAGEIVEGE
ncbi:MAG: TRAP transporter small permease [Gammaproteobacteria bacterium]|nr:TRAP transporter small permease [Gammaproteobacteria bacterium]MBT8109834.1 TRAP transporter small permease [Gammaproteobacteria bacterium]NNL44536.1 TRAP transporter small permease [Woeseiaceae bacterium]